jgi:serine/threonine protein kinase
MNQTQWQRVRELFEDALDTPPDNLEAWFSAQSSEDADVLAEVRSLLTHSSRVGAFLAEPLDAQMPQLLDDQPLQAGQTIGAYTIVREVGRGGMGRIYLATDTRLGRQVALKALPAQTTSDSRQRERLRREARAAASLTHPGICTVYALEELDGDLFIATEFLDGATLREEISKGPRPSAEQVIDTAKQLANALASAHAGGIVHRDLKPENVMRTQDNRLKILDFGLARLDSSAFDGAQVTQTGMLVGTPAYMAPEQLNGSPGDARSDVFAFGVLIYEFACGTHPFEAATPVAVAARVLETGAQPLESRCPSLPPGLLAIIDRCLRKAPVDRFPSAVELNDALEQLDASSQSDQPTMPQPSAPPRTRVLSWWRTHQIIVVGLYASAAIFGWNVKEWLHGPTTALFITMGIGAVVGGVFRGHLVFTQWMNPGGLHRERRRAMPATLTVDCIMGLALAIDGLMLSASEPLMAVLAFGLAAIIVLARILLEPATTHAAFGRV